MLQNKYVAILSLIQAGSTVGTIKLPSLHPHLYFRHKKSVIVNQYSSDLKKSDYPFCVYNHGVRI